jgi:hypothetical protein
MQQLFDMVSASKRRKNNRGGAVFAISQHIILTRTERWISFMIEDKYRKTGVIVLSPFSLVSLIHIGGPVDKYLRKGVELRL